MPGFLSNQVAQTHAFIVCGPIVHLFMAAVGIKGLCYIRHVNY